MNKEKVILVVDDSNIIREIIVSTLKEKGYNAIGYDNALEAKKFFKKNFQKILLIMTDVNLIDYDGLILVDYFKGLNPDVPILILSGYPSKEMLKRVPAKKNIHFVEKPFHLEELLYYIEQTEINDGSINDEKSDLKSKNNW